MGINEVIDNGKRLLFDIKFSQLPHLFHSLPWALYMKFFDLQSGCLFGAGRLLNFLHFQQEEYVYFATKQ